MLYLQKIMIAMDENRQQPMQTFDIRKFMKFFPDVYGAQLEHDFFIADIGHPHSISALRYPFRFDGYMAVCCLKGSLDLDVNLHSFHMQENSLFICVPGHIVRVTALDESLENRFVLVAISKEFATSIHIDFQRLSNEGLSLMSNPDVTLSTEEVRICHEYLNLAKDLLAFPAPHRKEALSSLISSCFYVLGSILGRRTREIHNAPAEQSARARMVFDQFIRLVTEFHSSERGMAFYADRLCLTPKYLSKLVKQVSGRSAPDWIDSFVILEAKNMLKYSGRNIKEIVYELHFPNQSVFYKFFKSHTGMTPSEYRNS